MNQKHSITIERIDNYRVRVPQQGSMITDGIVYADTAMMQHLQ